MSVIRHAKDLQEKEAAKNASILLQEVDMEKEREEVKKQAAARRREKKKKKKKNKLAGKDDGDKMAGKEEECEDDDEGMVVEKPESVKNLPKDGQGRWGWARSNPLDNGVPRRGRRRENLVPRFCNLCRHILSDLLNCFRENMISRYFS